MRLSSACNSYAPDAVCRYRVQDAGKRPGRNRFALSVLVFAGDLRSEVQRVRYELRKNRVVYRAGETGAVQRVRDGADGSEVRFRIL